MSNIKDARYAKCEDRIRKAMLELLSKKPLADIGVSELAREAEISRTTFYSHYENVGNVFDQLVAQVMSDVQSLEDRFVCKGHECGARNRPTYCEQIRSKGEWTEVTSDPRFFSSMMTLSDSARPLPYDPSELGVTPTESKVLHLFQMSGCHAVATSSYAKLEDWDRIRDLLDMFIEGGLQAIREGGKKR